jgi:hypothetical protein
MSRVKQKTLSVPPSQEPLESGPDSALPFLSNTVAPLCSRRCSRIAAEKVDSSNHKEKLVTGDLQPSFTSDLRKLSRPLLAANRKRLSRSASRPDSYNSLPQISPYFPMPRQRRGLELKCAGWPDMIFAH